MVEGRDRSSSALEGLEWTAVCLGVFGEQREQSRERSFGELCAWNGTI
jgi:hypothetical protein